MTVGAALLCYPWSSVTPSEFPSSGHDVCLCHPMWGWGGVTARGHRGRTRRGNQSSLSLCDSISRLCTHEWMPRDSSSEPRSEPQPRKALARTRWAGGERQCSPTPMLTPSAYFLREAGINNDMWNYEIKSIANKIQSERDECKQNPHAVPCGGRLERQLSLPVTPAATHINQQTGNRRNLSLLSIRSPHDETAIDRKSHEETTDFKPVILHSEQSAAQNIQPF